MHHLFQQCFLRIFPNEGLGSVNVDFTRKQPLPKEVLSQERFLEKCRERPEKIKPASLNSIMPLVPHLLSPPRLSWSLNSFQIPKQSSIPEKLPSNPIFTH